MDRTARKEAITAVQKSGRGMREALRGLLEWELAQAHAEMEAARDNIEIWRAQGRALEVRALMSAITPKDG